jgi:hypothetical protein
MRKLCADIKERIFMKTFLITDNDLTFSERVTEKLRPINKLLQNASEFPKE